MQLRLSIYHIFTSDVLWALCVIRVRENILVESETVGALVLPANSTVLTLEPLPARRRQ